VQPTATLQPLPLLGEPSTVSVWRREPYRILFPLGAAFAVVGTLPWLLFAAGMLPAYPRVFHALVQVQSFLACFIGGFLMTFVPRRTGAAPPAPWELTLAAVFPAAIAVGAGFGKIALAELAWLAWLIVLGRFVVVRFISAPMNPKPAPSMIWIPMSLGMGVFGTLVAGISAAKKEMLLHDLGQRLALQAMVCGLIMGVGGLLLPVLMQRSAAGAQRLSRTHHALLAVAFFASYPLELVTTPWAFALRAAVTGLVLVWGARLWRGPEQPGTHLWLAWAGAWALPLGHAFVAVFPAHRVAGLHIVFIGGFALLALAIGAHVTFAHGNRSDLLRQAPRQSRLLPCGVLLLVALLARAGLDWSGTHYTQSLALGALSFLAALGCWFWAILPVALSPPRVTHPPG
jgi:uncharacterized protein involved in response to NO